MGLGQFENANRKYFHKVISNLVSNKEVQNPNESSATIFPGVIDFFFLRIFFLASDMLSI
jgi:hypothetical protein